MLVRFTFVTLFMFKPPRISPNLGFFDCKVPKVRDDRQSAMFAQWINLLNLLCPEKHTATCHS